MKILILTFYYPPDIGAGSFRSAAFVNALKEELSKNDEIHIVTTCPNRYRAVNDEAPEFEKHGGVSVSRIRIPKHKSGMVDQTKAFVAYARGVLRIIKNRQYDLVFATSGRLATAALGRFCAKTVGAPLYIDIRDIFVDVLDGILKPPLKYILVPIFRSVERYTIEGASGINLVSEGFCNYFQTRYPGRDFSFLSNGIDEEFLDFPRYVLNLRPVPQVLYAGNIGQGQCLHCILPELAKQTAPNFEFLVVGDGGAKRRLEQALAERQVTNVRLLPPVRRKELKGYYLSADILFLHLNDFMAFERVLPSKIFEYAATGKPILAGVAGYSADFLRKNVTNAEVFSPCNSSDGVKALETLYLEWTDRRGFISRYRRDELMRKLTKDVLGRCVRK